MGDAGRAARGTRERRSDAGSKRDRSRARAHDEADAPRPLWPEAGARWHGATFGFQRPMSVSDHLSGQISLWATPPTGVADPTGGIADATGGIADPTGGVADP